MDLHLLHKKLKKQYKKNKPKTTNSHKKTWYCIICDKHYTTENKYYHFDTIIHHDNLKKFIIL